MEGSNRQRSTGANGTVLGDAQLAVAGSEVIRNEGLPLLLIGGELATVRVEPGAQLMGEQLQLGRTLRKFGVLRHLHAGVVIDEVMVLAVVEEGRELVVFLVFDRVVGVGVTLHAAEGGGLQGGPGGRHPILHGGHAKLLIVGTALSVVLGVAVEGSGQALVEGRLWQQIPSQLLDHEFVIWLVGIEGPDHPITPRPDGAGRIFFKTIGVGVACKVHPDDGPALAETWRIEQSIHDLLACGPRVVGGSRFELLELFGAGWKAG